MDMKELIDKIIKHIEKDRYYSDNLEIEIIKNNKVVYLYVYYEKKHIYTFNLERFHELNHRSGCSEVICKRLKIRLDECFVRKNFKRLYSDQRYFENLTNNCFIFTEKEFKIYNERMTKIFNLFNDFDNINKELRQDVLMCIFSMDEKVFDYKDIIDKLEESLFSKTFSELFILFTYLKINTFLVSREKRENFSIENIILKNAKDIVLMNDFDDIFELLEINYKI